MLFQHFKDGLLRKLDTLANPDCFLTADDVITELKAWIENHHTTKLTKALKKMSLENYGK